MVGRVASSSTQKPTVESPTTPPHHLRGLDMAWPWRMNPHRELGTRSRAAADVGQARGAAHVRQKGYAGTGWATPLGRVPYPPSLVSFLRVCSFGVGNVMGSTLGREGAS